jgi:OOP family OmpA-OmpF porin
VLCAMRALALSAILVLSTSVGMAQTDAPVTSGMKTRQLRNMTRNAIRLGDTHSGLLYCAELVKRMPESAKASFQMAELHRLTRNYTEAETWYAKTLKLDAERFPMAYFHLGDAQLSQEKHDAASKNFLSFKKVAKGVKDDRYRKLVGNRLLSCSYAIAMKDSARSALVASLGKDVNGPHVEFSPIVMNDSTLIYGSLMEDEVRYYGLETIDSANIPLRKLYMAMKRGDRWVSVGELPGPFNGMGAHIGNAALSGDGERMYFTVCQRNWQMKTICQLYYSDWKLTGWKDPVKMNDEINHNNYTTTQPTVGRESKKNREVLYFVSDRPKSKGGLDIWFTEYNKKKDTWSPPRNAGSKVNTAGTDCTPYYELSTHTLYFSSDGHPGLGGLDVFKAVGEKSKWEDPQNMRKDINSPADDLDYVPSADRKGGFLVSNRKGGISLLHETCCDDLYEFRWLEHVEILANLRMRSTDDCLTGTDLYVYIIDPETKDRYLAQRTRVEDCTYLLALEQGHRYRIEAKKDGHFSSGTDVNTHELKASTTFNKEIVLEKIPERPIVLEGILYEYNSAELTKDAKNTIDTTLLLILQRNPDIIIEIGSHTDSRGTDEYNLKLSQKRAQSVIKYLASAGISDRRLQATGYGESQPIAPNEHPDRTDNPEGRALNRRTEFRIVGMVNPDED